MGRLLAIDFGKARCGVAVSDSLQIIANPLDTVATKEIIPFLVSYCQSEQVDKIVVGLPKQMSGEDSESMRYIKPFVGRLKHAIPNIAIEMYDERFTSVLAHRAMIEGGMKKKDRQNKANVDKIAACIILEDYMQKKM
ncbi:MAG: Holliday junction resolvase RuvX [Paludibacteraceae bacterium]|nr:Holliday junction resolvase RuvX [Paludibacteraceae bacterium]